MAPELRDMGIAAEIHHNLSRALSPEAQDCRACHDKGGEVEDARGKMSCTMCHEIHDV